ncbi:MAG TPA: YkgJ family cysteine cluster protein [Candidatus Sulfobium mesophilum]|nr:YkgJ family cysteine cluster protein [Candidatus Sulfobium mesophilum]
MKKIECRKGCGACCIVISISSPIPGMPGGKPAGVRCVNLLPGNVCNIYRSPERPKTCRTFQASEEWCGMSREDAMERLSRLEILTIGPMGP